MKFYVLFVTLGLCFMGIFLPVAGAGENDKPSTREMNLINWQEFARWVPEKIETVLLPTGTLEPHGVLPNGSDNLAPEAMARELAAPLNALIAPTLNYGVTGSMRAFPGALAIQADTYQAFVEDILRGLARNGFKNIIVLNGHGGPQTALLRKAADRVSEPERVRILVINWWSLTLDITRKIFGENGGHAGNNETAYIQAIVPEHVHPEQYRPEMATAYPEANSWFAVPFPSSIGLYQKGQGYPTFDEEKAKAFYQQVNQKVLHLIQNIIARWDAAGLYRDP